MEDFEARARLRIVLAPEVAIGPGKADLLDGIAKTGSIAAAGRQLGMSYKRAWGLIEILNGYFPEPLVAKSRGGSGHGGAALTPLGAQVLALYRSMETEAGEVIAKDLSRLEALRDAPDG